MSSVSYIQCFIDGAARGQGTAAPTSAACACVVYKNKKELVRFARPLGSKTNNEAEYEALIQCLLICIGYDFPRPIIYSDSALVVNQTKGTWGLRTESLLPYFLTVQEIQSEYQFDIIQVPRAKVWLPDELCNLAIDNLEKQKAALKLVSIRKE